MKTSSAPKIDRSKAWSCLVTNLLVLPGMGSVMGGRKVGWVQMTVAILGGVLTILAVVKMAMFWMQTQQMPERTSDFALLLIGLAGFVGSWLWSLLTGWSLIKSAVPTPPPYAGTTSPR